MTADLSENMKAALRDLPLVRLWGGFWVPVGTVHPEATKGENGLDTSALDGVDHHRTNTVKALKRRGLVRLTHPDEGKEGRSWTEGTRAVLTDETRPGKSSPESSEGGITMGRDAAEDLQDFAERVRDLAQTGHPEALKHIQTSAENVLFGIEQGIYDG